MAARLLCRRALSAQAVGARLAPTSDAITSHPMNNVGPAIAAKIGRNLHLQEDHPLSNIKRTIEGHFASAAADVTAADVTGSASELPPRPFATFDDLSPIVTVEQNFDQLLTPPDHVSRSPSDTFYVDAERVLRCHTSAHQNELIAAGHRAFLCTGDVYRRDTVDRSHYPAFHQMEGVRVFSDDEIDPSLPRAQRVAAAERDLKSSLEGMVSALFGAGTPTRWVDAHFPFTEPSFELEVQFGGEWLEVLGCGVVQQQILRNCGRGEEVGWAFGLGLERLAMVRWGIPDIRLFWSEDRRFLDQFRFGSEAAFRPFSKYPPCLKDVSFWLPEGAATGALEDRDDGAEGAVAEKGCEIFCENDVHDCVREEAGDLAEAVRLIDVFVHPKTGRTSHCYRITYRSMERNLTNEEIDAVQERVRARVAARGCELR
jgi:phenylalanyl-tRNA synthetase alpha chain